MLLVYSCWYWLHDCACFPDGGDRAGADQEDPRADRVRGLPALCWVLGSTLWFQRCGSLCDVAQAAGQHGVGPCASAQREATAARRQVRIANFRFNDPVTTALAFARAHSQQLLAAEKAETVKLAASERVSGNFPHCCHRYIPALSVAETARGGGWTPGAASRAATGGTTSKRRDGDPQPILVCGLLALKGGTWCVWCADSARIPGQGRCGSESCLSEHFPCTSICAVMHDRKRAGAQDAESALVKEQRVRIQVQPFCMRFCRTLQVIHSIGLSFFAHRFKASSRHSSSTLRSSRRGSLGRLRSWPSRKPRRFAPAVAQG